MLGIIKKMNSDIINKESKKYIEELNSGLVPDILKKEYFEYVKNHIIFVLLSLSKNYIGLNRDDVFHYLESIDENRCLFNIEVFKTISDNIAFFDKKYWNEIITLHHSALNLIKPGWWDRVRIKNQYWIEIRENANNLITKLKIEKIDSFEFSERFIDDSILTKITIYNKQN